eukprot:scaffold122410_cov54-Prasinocladus_malaysianus.AAC.1
MELLDTAELYGAHPLHACRDKLPILLREEKFDWVVLTSPEAASVFVEGWESAGRPAIRLAVVGKGTGVALQGTGLEVAFVPQQVGVGAALTQVDINDKETWPPMQFRSRQSCQGQALCSIQLPSKRPPSCRMDSLLAASQYAGSTHTPPYG